VKRWFLPSMPDLLGLLQAQAAVTERGIDRFVVWSHGGAEAVAAGEDVRRLEHEADDARRQVQTALRAAFSTPLDPEDIYELSERMDVVINDAKNIVREAELMDMAPDEHMAAMAECLAAAQRELGIGIAALGHDDDAATAASDAAVKSCRHTERAYRSAMSELLTIDDVREVTARRELYRRFSRAADAVEAVAERIWYVVVKQP
jgi:uncharacterized protein